MNSITRDKMKFWAILLWLVIWELVSRYIGQEILLVSPVTVFLRFIQLSVTADFWKTIGFSFLRITGGYILALIASSLLAGLSAANKYIRYMAAPPIAAIKATPVASFTILILIWVPSRNLSVVISFIMVLPLIYKNLLEGIANTDIKLLEMSKVFRLTFYRKVRYIYTPQVMPYFRTACTLSLGMCWKAGIAAEVIGIPKGSIGERLYEAKVYLETPDLFAWTMTIVLLSLLFEKCILYILHRWSNRQGGE